ncbi:hypothetical protein [Streptomyces sp. NPDC055749]
MRDASEAGSALFDELAGEPRLRAYHPFVTPLADLLHGHGRRTQTSTAYRKTFGPAGDADLEIWL